MRQLILFFATVGLVYAMSNPKFHELIVSLAGHSLSKDAVTLIMAVVFGIVIVLIDNSFPCTAVREDFLYQGQRYSTNPSTQYVAMDQYYGNQMFQVPVGVDAEYQPKFDHFSKYYIGRNEGNLRKYSAASDKPAACAYAAAGGVLPSPASVVFQGKPLSYFQALSQNSGMPLWNVRWK